jgi:isopentenyl-diphosphate delta-isomerase
MEEVILVDKQDNAQGSMDKMEAHVQGKLHRAVSVFLFNSAGDLLLQQRAVEKYHSAGKWSNTCCSHPRPGEANMDAAHRRLMEEMGMECHLKHQFSFIYRTEFNNGLVEHEYDHVFTGVSDELPVPDPAEAADYRYLSPVDIANDLRQYPDNYTEWFKICFKRMVKFG